MVKADAKLVPSLCSWCSPSRRQPGRGDREGAGVELVRPGVAVPRRPAAPPPTGLVCPGGKCATSPTRITSQLLSHPVISRWRTVLWQKCEAAKQGSSLHILSISFLVYC